MSALHHLASRRQNNSSLAPSFITRARFSFPSATRVSSPALVPDPPFSTSRISSAFSDLALVCGPRRESPEVHARHLWLFSVCGVCRCILVVSRQPSIPRPISHRCVLHLLCRAIDSPLDHARPSSRRHHGIDNSGDHADRFSSSPRLNFSTVIGTEGSPPKNVVASQFSIDRSPHGSLIKVRKIIYFLLKMDLGFLQHIPNFKDICS
jgi:hypothetical protein